MFYKHKCPYCRDKEIVRVKRRWWMRIFIFSRCFSCKMYNHVFITLFNFIVIDFGVQSTKTIF